MRACKVVKSSVRLELFGSDCVEDWEVDLVRCFVETAFADDLRVDRRPYVRFREHFRDMVTGGVGAERDYRSIPFGRFASSVSVFGVHDSDVVEIAHVTRPPILRQTKRVRQI